jgi:hypothetical protein
MSTDTALERTTGENAPAHQLVHGSTWALARLTEEQFDHMLEKAVVGRGRVQKVMRAMMRAGIHFYSMRDLKGGGKPPADGKPRGDDRQILSKAGAEVLRSAFGLVSVPVSTVIYGDGKTAPEITARTRTEIHADSADGPVVAVADAACNSWEIKYRYRQGDRVCPECGAPAIIKGLEKYGGGWVCFKKKNGCGKTWPDGAAVIEDQKVGRVANEDPHDLLNTLIGMSEKRAANRATITATATTDLFAPDHPEKEDNEHEGAPQGESERLREEFFELCRKGGVTKNQQLWHLMSEILGRPARDVKALSVDDLRALVAGCRERFIAEAEEEAPVDERP